MIDCDFRINLISSSLSHKKIKKIAGILNYCTYIMGPRAGLSCTMAIAGICELAHTVSFLHLQPGIYMQVEQWITFTIYRSWFLDCKYEVMCSRYVFESICNRYSISHCTIVIYEDKVYQCSPLVSALMA